MKNDIRFKIRTNSRAFIYQMRAYRYRLSMRFARKRDEFHRKSKIWKLITLRRRPW